jgi:hypothetical protein
MDFNDSAVKRKHLNGNANELLLLKTRKDAIKHSVLAPAVHTGVNAVPNTKMFRQSSPFTAMLRNMKDRIQRLEVVKMHISSLTREAVGNSIVLFPGDFHT